MNIIINYKYFFYLYYNIYIKFFYSLIKKYGINKSNY